VDFARRYQSKATAELRLRAELAEAELHRVDSEMRVLKLELNPHMVLNALNSVSALLYVDPERARDVLVRLGELLRRTLENSELQQVPLAEEIRQLQPYVDIQRVRFGTQLRVEWEVDDDTRDLPVPHMVLQPLVENAIKHGISGSGGPAEIRIRARRSGATLQLQVCDNGRGPSDYEGMPARGGVGLANVRSRLARIHGSAARFDLAAGPDGGAVATVSLPAGVQTAPAAPVS
jgi:two-component system, LytTR family, sensor kinase